MDTRPPSNSQMLGFRFLSFALRILSPLAPGDFRDRWRNEWVGEAAHWAGAREPGSGRSRPGALALLTGALRDALDLRFFRPLSRARSRDPLHRREDTAMLRSILGDIRFGLRSARSAPWYSAITILTLAMGIGASVAMFAVLHAALIRPLPFPNAEELVAGRATFRGQLNPWVSGADYYDYRDGSSSFRELAAILPFPQEMTESARGEAHRVPVSVISTNLLAALEVTPAMGRGFSPDEGQAGAPDVVLVSDGYWRNRLGGDPAALGSSLRLDGNPFTVVGIMPQGFFFMTPADLWIPMRPDRMAASSRGNHNWYLLGRMAPGITLEQAQEELDVISVHLQEEYPETNTDKALQLTELHEVLTEDYHMSLWLLSGGVALVLLIACGNGAGILLARVPARRFDLAIRAAIGAPRGRLVRQLISESMALALAAGVIGTILAFWFQEIILRYLRMERLDLAQAQISPAVLASALALTLLSGLLAGVYPAVRAADTSVTESLKSGHWRWGYGGARFRSGLVVAQVAVSIVLLAGSGLLIRSLTNLQNLDPGFDTHGILTAEVQLSGTRYPTVEDRQHFLTILQAELRATPGVEEVTMGSHLPIADFGNIYRASAQGGTEEPARIFLRAVFPGFFEALGIPLLAGRDMEETDGPESPWVVILGESAARRLFPGQDPLGKIVELPFAPNPRPAEVVGVVGDARLSRLEEEPEAAVYVPYAHHPRLEMRLILRGAVPPPTLAGSLGEILRRMDPEVPLSRVATLESLVSDSMAERRIVTLSLALLALLPLFLGSIGLFAVLAYHVSRRRHEMGVRMALGADGSHVSRLVIGEGLKLAGVGVLLGLAGTVVSTRLLQGFLFGVTPRDPTVLLAVVMLVMGVETLACAVPALRATRADPRVVLDEGC